MCRHNSLSGDDPRYMTHMIASHRSGQDENCSADGYAGLPPVQENWSLHRGRGPAIQATLPPRNGLRVSRMEVRCPNPCSKAAGDAMQVSSACYVCPLVRQWQENWRVSGCSAFCRPHHTHDCEFCLKISWRWEPPCSATRQILTLTEDWFHRLARKPRAAGASRPVEATARRWPSWLKESRSATVTEHLSDTMTEVLPLLSSVLR